MKCWSSCIDCNRWGHPGDEKLIMELLENKLFSRVAPPSHLPNPAPDALSAGLFYERQHSVGPLFMPLTIYAGILATMAIATPRPIKPNAVRSQSQR